MHGESVQRLRFTYQFACLSSDSRREERLFLAAAENQKQKQELDPLNPIETIRAVICYVYDEPRRKYLLIHKAKGKFGGGFWNGPGGKIEAGESAEEAAKREMFEETGLRISNLEEAGTLEFYFGHGKQKPDWTAVVFKTTEYRGKLKARSEEGTLRWIGENRASIGSHVGR